MTVALDLIISEERSNREVRRLMSEMPKRLEAFQKALPQRVARRLMNEIEGKAPSDIEGYPDCLKLCTVQVSGGWDVCGILASGRAGSQKLRSVDAQRTVLYVRPKARGDKAVSEAAVVLSRYNPWTMDTLPHEPSKREAEMISRRVTEREGRRVESARRRDLPGVLQQLRPMGVQLRPKGQVVLSGRVTRDLAFEVLRREFGWPPVPGHAHWRPALGGIMNIIRKEIAALFPMISDPSDRSFEEVRDLQVEKASTAKKVQEFQDLVATGLA